MRLCRATRAEEKARAERAAKRAAAKTRETGDPETVKTWLDSKRVVHSPGHVLPLPAAYVDYEADCRTHGETSVARGRRFAEELRKLGLDVWRSPHRQAAAGCASPIRVRRGIAKGRGMSAACSRPLALRRLRRKTFGGSISWQRESLFPCSDACLRLSLGVVVAFGCRSLFAILTLPPFPLPNPTRDITRHRARHVLCHAAP